ncbi:MAG: hypothetical protein ACRENG_16160 [bacterium]
MSSKMIVKTACFSKLPYLSAGFEAGAVSHYFNATQAAQIIVG